MNVYLILALVGLVSLALPIFYLKWRDYKDGKSDTVVVSFDAPKDLSVLEVGYFYDNKLMFKDVLAWLMECVLKGNLVIERDGGLKVKVVKKPKDVSEIERQVWRSFFGEEDELNLLSLQRSYLQKLVGVIMQFRSDLVEKGYYKKGARGLWLWAFVFMILVDYVVVNLFPEVGVVDWYWQIFCLMILPFTGMLIALFTPRRTEKGKELYRRLSGFGRYLKVAEKDREKFRQELLLRVEERGSMVEFSNLIPYMIVLNVDKKWYETLVPEMQELVNGEDFLGVVSSY